MLGCATLLLALLSPCGAPAQEPPAEPPGPPAPEDSAAVKASKRPGRFRMGPFYLTPKFHVQNIGLDTNVFYTPTDRQTDVMASGGPGLDLVLPVGPTGTIYGRGILDYLYFVRTPSQRRLNGSVSTGADFQGARTQLTAEQLWGRAFSRPSYQVNERIETYSESSRLNFRRGLFGRLYLRGEGSRLRSDIEQSVDYLGTDLRQTLSETRYLAGGGLEYAITVKTSFVVEANEQWDRFLYQPSRDADSTRVVAGFRTDSTALISGQALVGRRSFRPVAAPDVDQRLTVADVAATLNVTPRTHIGFTYARDLSYSAFDTTGSTPTVITEGYGVNIDKRLTTHIDLQLFGRVTRFRTNGEITVILPDEGSVVAVRSDRAAQAGADLGYVFRSRLRIGVSAIYTQRNSTIQYFGIDGLLMGLTVNYTP
jgi:hypothetical protein